MTGPLLSSLADEGWRQLDLAGCSKLYGAQLLAVVARMPQLTALDVTGVLRGVARSQVQELALHAAGCCVSVC